jgi:hypothetical protein
VVEHYRGSILEGQPQRTPAAEGSQGGRPLSSKPQRCQGFRGVGPVDGRKVGFTQRNLFTCDLGEIGEMGHRDSNQP